jgi:hypothetical protein
VRKKLLIVALVVGLFLATAMPVLAAGGPQNACHAPRLRGIFAPEDGPPPVADISLVPFPTDPFGLTGGTAEILLDSGVTIVLTYDEGEVLPPPWVDPVTYAAKVGFQCPQNPADQNDTIVSIRAVPPSKP